MKETEAAKHLGKTGGYQTAIFNLLFLLQMRVNKFMTNEKFDDDLFRTYFVRIYKNIVNMETEFIGALEESE
jgi:hypothetical protein